MVSQWRDYVRQAAEQSWPAEGLLMLTIMYFYDREAREIDVDNIPKPILDSIKGLVYQDDSQITDLVCRKRELNEHLRPANLSGVLREAIVQNQSFVYVLVEQSPVQGAFHL
jgi:hypothetical protein